MEQLIERTVKIWLNKNRPDLLISNNLIKMITSQILVEANADSDVNEIEYFTIEYLSINYSEALVGIVEDTIQDNFPEIKIQWKNYGLYSEEITQVLKKLAEENVGENNLKMDGSQFVYSDEIKEHILAVTKKHINENW